jgi:hypothetical protein
MSNYRFPGLSRVGEDEEGPPRHSGNDGGDHKVKAQLLGGDHKVKAQLLLLEMEVGN